MRVREQEWGCLEGVNWCEGVCPCWGELPGCERETWRQPASRETARSGGVCAALSSAPRSAAVFCPGRGTPVWGWGVCARGVGPW